MKLYHLLCKKELTVTTTMIKVSLRSFSVGRNSVKPDLIDLEFDDTGTISIFCPECGRPVPWEEVAVLCGRCADSYIPVNAVGEAGPEYPMLCKKCTEDVHRYTIGSLDGYEYKARRLKLTML